MHTSLSNPRAVLAVVVTCVFVGDSRAIAPARSYLASCAQLRSDIVVVARDVKRQDGRFAGAAPPKGQFSA
jgi:hypothetical protein